MSHSQDHMNSQAASAHTGTAALKWSYFALALVLVVLAVATRAQLQFGKPWWNFTPMVAIALFAGACFRKGWVFVIPLLAIFLSDCVIEVAYRLGYAETWGFYAGSAFTYPAYILVAALGMLLRRPHRHLGSKGKSGALGFLSIAVGAGLAGSVVFFLFTNFGSWVLNYGNYEKSLAGLMASYAAGVPFYRQQFLGDIFYSAVLFGSYLLAAHMIPAFGTQREQLAYERIEKR